MASRLLGRWMAVELTPKEKGPVGGEDAVGRPPTCQGDKD